MVFGAQPISAVVTFPVALPTYASFSSQNISVVNATITSINQYALEYRVTLTPSSGTEEVLFTVLGSDYIAEAGPVVFRYVEGE